MLFYSIHAIINFLSNNIRLVHNQFKTQYNHLGIPLSSLDESDQGDLENILPDNVTIDKIEKEVSLLVDRVQELETIIESCYEKLGETSKDKFLPDLVFCQHKLLLERDIKIEELKQKVQSQQKTMRLAREKERRAREESEKNKEGKDEVEKSLDTLKVNRQKAQYCLIRLSYLF
ncbi:hypothetical protein DPMN_115832 [Dreissena polymorpha]|uniref:Uncharacterized protein n=1 Tax=Dreissena polymorpha TaxID=45954 RepID=A0A9D4KMK3_DREPO|nr:hypothetical protein DPMN_115832 [Dreissena polymorpha]